MPSLPSAKRQRTSLVDLVDSDDDAGATIDLADSDDETLESQASTMRGALPLPPELQCKLRAHQTLGVQFLLSNIRQNKGCMLADFMGLGKTLQTLCMLSIYLGEDDSRKALVLAPNSAIISWEKDCARFVPWVLLHVCNSGTRPKRMEVVKRWNQQGGVLVMGYELFRQLVVPTNTRSTNENVDSDDGSTRLPLFFLRLNPADTLVLDEAHRIKRGTGASKLLDALFRVCRCQEEASVHSVSSNSGGTMRRVALTGYPVQNNIMEVSLNFHNVVFQVSITFTSSFIIC
jgi:SNF2 family DNA or RNA helicase